MTAFIEIILIAISLALDSLSVSIAGGITQKKSNLANAAKVAFFFGIFQAVMPIFGWLLGSYLSQTFSEITPWIAFVILVCIGIKFIKEALDKKEENKTNILSSKTLLILSFATSIDALIVGITLPLLNISFPTAIITIGIVTFILCFLGFIFGKQIGIRFGKKIEVLGGIVLIGIGMKILLEGIL